MNDGDPGREARKRQQERAARVERVLEANVEADAYPVSSEKLAAQYRASEMELANETETLADAFDRIADEYESFADPDAAREALMMELGRDERFDEAFRDAPD